MLFKCYTRNQLERYMHGKLSQELCDQIAEHLTGCEVCEDTVIGLDSAHDTLVDLLKKDDQPDSDIESDLDSPDAFNQSSDQLAGFFEHQRIEELPEFQAAVDAVRSQVFREKMPDVLPADDPIIGVQIGDYELEEQIASGGMGSVFRARHTRLEKQVAFKILPERKMQNGDAISRFSREMKIIGQMDHPTMVSATDAGVADGMHYLAMELVDGMDLSQIVRLHGPLAPADACEIVRLAAMGLQYAHDQDVVHRDVKPSNLMLTRDGNVKILDLGLATLGGLHGTVDELTTVGQLMGTLDYMAPEQCGDQSIDARTDVYGLGATLYKLLTGSAPYSNPAADTPLKKLKAMALSPPTPILDRRADLSDELAEVIANSLQRDSKDRFQTAEEFAAALEPFCQGQEIEKLVIRAEHLAKQNQVSGLNPPLAIQNELPPPKLTRPTAPRKTIEKPKSRSGWTSWITGFCLLAIAGFMGFSGITIYLDTIAGELVIESELEDAITISIVHDEKPTREIQIDHGSKSTKLRAGKYRIEIKGESNDLVVKNDVFELKKGGTVVARITRKNSNQTATKETNVTNPTVPLTSTRQLPQRKSVNEKLQLIDLEHQLEIAELELERHKAEYERTKKLFERGSISSSSMKQTEIEIAVAQRNVETAKAKLQAIRDSNSQTGVTIPETSGMQPPVGPLNYLHIIDIEHDRELAKLNLKTAVDRIERLGKGAGGMVLQQARADRSKAEIELKRAEAKLAAARQQWNDRRQGEIDGNELKLIQIKSDLNNAEQTLLHSSRLQEKGYVTEAQVQQDETKVRKLKQELKFLEDQQKRLEGKSVSSEKTNTTQTMAETDTNENQTPLPATYRGRSLDDYVDNAIQATRLNQSADSFEKPIKLLVDKSKPIHLETLLNHVISKNQNEISIRDQQGIVTIMSYLCKSDKTVHQALIYIQKVVDEKDTNPWISAKLFMPLAMNHFDQVQEFLLDNYPDAAPGFKSASVAWLLEFGFDDQIALSRTVAVPNRDVHRDISKRWRDLLLKDASSMEDTLAFLCCRALSWNWHDDPAAVKLFGTLLNDPRLQIRLAAIDSLSSAQVKHPDLVNSIVTTIEQEGESPVRLLRLTNDRITMDAIKKMLADPSAGFDKREGDRAWDQRVKFISGLNRTEFNSVKFELLPHLKKELEQAVSEAVLNATWKTVAAFEDTKIPPLFKGRSFSQWLNRLGSDGLSEAEQIESLRAIDNLKSSFQPDEIVAIARAVRGMEFPRGYPKSGPLRTLKDLFTSDGTARSLLASLDHLPDEDVMFGLYLLVNLHNNVIQQGRERIAKYARGYLGADDPVVRRRALYVAAQNTLATTSGKQRILWPYSETLSASDVDIELKLSLLAARTVSWDEKYFEIPFDAINDAKLVSTILSLASLQQQQNKIRRFVLDQLAANRSYLEKHQRPMNLDLWNGPIKDDPVMDDYPVSIFDQIISAMDALSQDELAYFNPVKFGDKDLLVKKQEALKNLTQWLPKTDGATERRLKRILEQLDSAAKQNCP